MVESTKENKSETESLEVKLYNIKLGDDNYDTVLEKAEKFKNEGNAFVKENKF